MRTRLEPGEELVRQGFANVLVAPTYANGRLYLTDRRLVFEGRDGGEIDVPFEWVAAVAPDWSRAFGVRLFPNAVAVTTTDGRTVRFVVFGRRGWLAAIDRARGAPGD